MQRNLEWSRKRRLLLVWWLWFFVLLTYLFTTERSFGTLHVSLEPLQLVDGSNQTNKAFPADNETLHIIKCLVGNLSRSVQTHQNSQSNFAPDVLTETRADEVAEKADDDVGDSTREVDDDADHSAITTTTRTGEINGTTASGPFAHLKTLVIVQGALRGGDIPWQTLKANVLDYNPNTDLALFVGEPPPRYNNSILFQWAKYSWQFREYEDWGVALDEAFGTEWRSTILPRLHHNSNILGGIKESRRGSGAVNFMIRYWLHQKIQEHGLVEKYDRFVITRADHFYLCPHDLSELDTSNTMFIPEGEDYRGINDRHLVVGKDQVLKALDWFPHFTKHFEQYSLSGYLPSTESILVSYWKLTGLHQSVNRIKRNMFICMMDQNEQTRTFSSRHKGPHGVLIKYYGEYVASMKTCDRIYGIVLPPAEREALEKARSAFCGECIWYGGNTCEQRMEYLQINYKLEEVEALTSVMEASPVCQQQNSTSPALR